MTHFFFFLPAAAIAAMRLAPYFLRPAAAATAAGLRAPLAAAERFKAANRFPDPGLLVFFAVAYDLRACRLLANDFFFILSPLGRGFEPLPPGLRRSVRVLSSHP